MENTLLSSPLAQPLLFDLPSDSTGTVELFPAVWSAAEELTAPEAPQRRAALDRLLGLKAPRISPLVAYLLATRLTEPDMALRARVVEALGNLFVPDENGNACPDIVRRHLMHSLNQMRTRQVFALLEVAIHHPEHETHIFRLLNACPFGGNHLSAIASERRAALTVRQKAAYFIGFVGFLDALPTLERLASRLEARLAGQQAMPFAHPGHDEIDLLPAVRSAIELLRTP